MSRGAFSYTLDNSTTAMKVSFIDMTPFISRPPELAELAGNTEDERTRDNKLVVIVPSFHDEHRLRRFFSAVAQQTFRSFDIVVVYAPDDTFVKNPLLSILHIRRKRDFGFAGAVYLGQLIAQRDSYEYFLITDVDKLPTDQFVFDRMMRVATTSGTDIVCGRYSLWATSGEKFIERKLPKGFPRVWGTIWWLCRTKLLQSAGLYLLPLYMGLDELEYRYRLLHCSKSKLIELDCKLFTTDFQQKTHYQSSLLFGGRDKSYLYPSLIGIFNFPEIYLDRSILNVAINFTYKFISLNLLRERIPAIQIYEEFAKNSKFGYFIWEIGSLDLVSNKIEAKEMNNDFEIVMDDSERKTSRKAFFGLTINERVGVFLGSLFGIIRRPLLSATSMSYFIMPLLFDKFYLIDDSAKVVYKCHWIRPLNGPEKIWTLVKTTMMVVRYIVRAFMNSKSRTNPYCGYGPRDRRGQA
jgi:glycosyltransferase involved in cell wall biosynthesis